MFKIRENIYNLFVYIYIIILLFVVLYYIYNSAENFANNDGQPQNPSPSDIANMNQQGQGSGDQPQNPPPSEISTTEITDDNLLKYLSENTELDAGGNIITKNVISTENEKNRDIVNKIINRFINKLEDNINYYINSI